MTHPHSERFDVLFRNLFVHSEFTKPVNLRNLRSLEFITSVSPRAAAITNAPAHTTRDAQQPAEAMIGGLPIPCEHKVRRFSYFWACFQMCNDAKH